MCPWESPGSWATPPATRGRGLCTECEERHRERRSPERGRERSSYLLVPEGGDRCERVRPLPPGVTPLPVPSPGQSPQRESVPTLTHQQLPSRAVTAAAGPLLANSPHESSSRWVSRVGCL